MTTTVQHALQSHDYFRDDVQDRLPADEIDRRLSIKEHFQSLYRIWQVQDQHCALSSFRSFVNSLILKKNRTDAVYLQCGSKSNTKTLFRFWDLVGAISLVWPL